MTKFGQTSMIEEYTPQKIHHYLSSGNHEFSLAFSLCVCVCEAVQTLSDRFSLSIKIFNCQSMCEDGKNPTPLCLLNMKANSTMLFHSLCALL